MQVVNVGALEPDSASWVAGAGTKATVPAAPAAVDGVVIEIVLVPTAILDNKVVATPTLLVVSGDVTLTELPVPLTENGTLRLGMRLPY